MCGVDRVTATAESEVAADAVSDGTGQTAGQAVFGRCWEGIEEARLRVLDDASVAVRGDLAGGQCIAQDPPHVGPAGPHGGGPAHFAGQGVADDVTGSVPGEALPTGEATVSQGAGRCL